ncbi:MULTISPECIES: hypothetical protein [Streptomyces]|uniref:Uncharacterized protein n=1 Tax=Streptomyces mordarskii TaxID=1226758 RepID=A0ABN1C782_9ACTN
MSNSQVPGSTSAPGRRTFLASTAVAAAAVAGGTPLLSGCSAEEGSGKGGATSGKELKNLLPTYAASTVADPDIPSVNGSSPGYTKAPPAAALVASVKGKPGHGGSYTMFEPLWGTPPPKHNAYYQAADDALGAKISLQPQDGNTYGEQLGAVLLNHGRTPAVVPLPSPRTDLLTGRAHHTGVRLDRFAVMVLAPPGSPLRPTPHPKGQAPCDEPPERSSWPR